MQELVREIARWDEYELLDSGGYEKLERFGDMTVVRPEPLAIWSAVNASAFDDADVVYERAEGRDGRWNYKKKPSPNWSVQYQDLIFGLRPTAFKHVGLFPEQAVNWERIREWIRPGDRVLNLFGYTGGAAFAAAKMGAEVVHVDASRPVVEWAKENAERSGLKAAPVRYITEDAMKFVEREIRRRNGYDMIILDPPAFGHGPKNELWKFERDVPILLTHLFSLMRPERGMLLFNAYSLGFPALSLEQVVRQHVSSAKQVSVVETCLQESSKRGFVLPTGITIRASW